MKCCRVKAESRVMLKTALFALDARLAIPNRMVLGERFMAFLGDICAVDEKPNCTQAVYTTI